MQPHCCPVKQTTPARRPAVWLIGLSRGHRTDVGCPVHERVESARPITASSTSWHPSSSLRRA